MVHDVHERLKADLAKPKVLVSVFSRSRFVLAVVHMEHGYLIFADESVELLHDSIEIMYDVVARIAGVTSVKAHTKLVIMTHSIIDSRKLLKVSSNLTALSRHGLQSYVACGVRGQDFIQALYYACNSFVHALSYM